MKSIAVCCLTRNRPLMLEAALSSVLKLETPEGCELLFICVENDSEARSRHIVEKMLNNMAHEYVLEPRHGIAIARNTAMKTAISRGADAIAFFDDDETVDPYWIRELNSVMTTRGLHLTGGPVRVAFEQQDSVLARLIARGISTKYRWRAWKKRIRPQQAAICTNNCLIRADIVTQHGIYFDERLKAGSDYRFYLDVRSRGLKHGWASTAIVSELWPNERLSISYYFERGRAQAKSAVLSSRHAGHGAVYLTCIVMGRMLITIANSLALLLISPLQPAASFLQLTRNIGRMMGYVEGARDRGDKSIYDQTTGR
jgi:succinoglycan biosynthesis protein ExoM